jgi:Polysaccharide lyase
VTQSNQIATWSGWGASPTIQTTNWLSDLYFNPGGDITTVAFIDDPRGGGKKALRCSLNGTQAGNDLNGKVLVGPLLWGNNYQSSADEAWLGLDVFLPSGLPLVGLSPNFYFVQWMEIYGPPTSGSPELGFGITAYFDPGQDQNSWVLSRGSDYGYDFPWRGPPIVYDVWHHWVIHVKLSSDPAIGFIEIWLNSVKQTFTDSTQKLFFKTVGVPNYDGPNRLILDEYRSPEVMSGTYSITHGEPKFGSSYNDVATGVNITPTVQVKVAATASVVTRNLTPVAQMKFAVTALVAAPYIPPVVVRPSRTVYWQYILDDGANVQLADLETSAMERTIKRTRNGPAQVTFKLNLEDEESGLLLNALGGIPRVRVYRNGLLRFRGIMAALRETAGDDAILECTFMSPFWRLLGDGSSNGRFTGSNVSFTTVDAGQIVKSLFDTANAASETGISTSGTIETTANRTIDYVYKNIGQATVDLSQIEPGFDFEERPLEGPGPKLVELYIHSSQGVMTNAVFQYGPHTIDNVTEVTRTTQPPANHVIVTGANDLVGEAIDNASITSYGKWMEVVSASDISDQPTLDARAADHIRPLPVRVIGFTPDPAFAPIPFEEYDIGDTVTLHADRGNFQYDGQPRINSIQVNIDDTGEEVGHEVTVEET